jgi:type II secretory pathway pseudopilin PulG
MAAPARHGTSRVWDRQPRVWRAGGFTIIEPLVLVILLSIVVSGTAVVLTSVNRSSAEARRVVTMDQEIDSQLAQIKQLSGQLTCCSSVCTVTPPTTFGTTANCATNNPLDSRYFYPQRDDPATTATIAGTSPATSDERAAVDQLCASGAFLNPLLTAVNALAQPAGVTRTAAAQANRTIRIVYTDTVNSRVTRVANITPPMSRWCP